MRVKVRMEKVANPIEFEASGAYEKGSFYCIRTGDTVIKIPIINIFQVVEDYGYHSPKGSPELEVDDEDTKNIEAAGYGPQ
jgi:hypothetical protein